DRIAEGKQPACVHHCLAKCMEAVTLEELPVRMAELGGKGVACFLPQAV
ncbi:MAG: oxidoreductase, partial [Eggerthellaceae bacterium]|nr:oxidoreductase [Eggerthellaceae bacterium]